MSEQLPEVPPARLSEKFFQKDAEVSFVSADRVIFKIHLKNLETSTGGFPPAEFKPDDEETTPLPEDAETLELLFAFMYPNHHPRLDDTPSELLLKVADAAEKYQVYAAINICYIRVKAIAKDVPLPVMIHAFKYDYPDLLRDTAPVLLDIPLDDLVKQLPMALVVPWVRYYEDRRRSSAKCLKEVQFLHPDKNCYRCKACEQDLAMFMFSIFGADPIMLSQETLCSVIRKAFENAVHLSFDPQYNALTEALPKPVDFTTFLRYED